MPDEMNPEMNPEMSAPAPEMGAEPNSQPLGSSNGEVDREGAIAKADLYKLANYSHKLFKQIHDDDQMEAWVQAKITKAADYIASVYHYLEYEMKFSEYGHHLDNSDTLSEGQKMRIKEMLAEAKDKMKDLKKSQAEKVKEKKMDEGILSGGDRPCTECGGTGMVYEEPKPIPAHVKGKVAKYNTMVKATKAAHKRMDANGDGVPDEEVVDEEFTDKSKVGDTFKTRTGIATKTDTGMKHNNTSYHDDGEAEEKSGKGVKSHAKAQSAAEKKDRAPAQKQSPKSAKTWGMKDGSKFDNRDKPKDESVAEGKKKGDGNLANNAKPYDKVTRGDVIAGRLGKDEKGGKAVKEAAKWRDPKHKDKLYTQEPRDPDDYYQSDDDYYNPKPDDYPGAKNLKGGSEYRHNDPLRTGYGRYGVGSLNTHGKRKGMPSRDHITSLKGSIKDAHGKHPHPNLPEAAKPSAGLSKAKKSAVVKDAKAGKDIGKPGKGFDKLAKKAGGGEKGEKIAAAAMWKNIKETTAYIAEKAKATKPDFLDMDKDGDKKEPMKKAVADKKKETVKESTDFSRMQEQLARLNRSEKPTLVENREVDQIRALTQRLLG
jgi:hypothetical protein